MKAKPFFYQETQGIRISVRPLYLEEQSQPILRRYVFAYFIRIENVSQHTVQLLTRHWYIHRLESAKIARWPAMEWWASSQRSSQAMCMNIRASAF